MADNLWMKRKLWLLKQEWPLPLRDGPQKSHQSQRTVREVFFRLPSTILPPVSVFSSEMRYTLDVGEELKFLQLRNCQLKRVRYAPKARFSRTFVGPSNLLEKVPAEWVIHAPRRAIGLPHQLRDDMHVANRREEIRDVSERPINVHLLKVSLTKTFCIQLIILIRTFQQHVTAMTYNLTSNLWASLIILPEG